jgi:hypothetical protein
MRVLGMRDPRAHTQRCLTFRQRAGTDTITQAAPAIAETAHVVLGQAPLPGC